MKFICSFNVNTKHEFGPLSEKTVLIKRIPLDVLKRMDASTRLSQLPSDVTFAHGRQVPVLKTQSEMTRQFLNYQCFSKQSLLHRSRGDHHKRYLKPVRLFLEFHVSLQETDYKGSTGRRPSRQEGILKYFRPLSPFCNISSFFYEHQSLLFIFLAL